MSMTFIREINILLSLQHPNIVNVSEVVVGRSIDSIFMVMEFVEHDLRYLLDQVMKTGFAIAEVWLLSGSQNGGWKRCRTCATGIANF